MKNMCVKKYLASLLGVVCILGLCSGCGQEKNAAQGQEITEIPEEDYRSDEEPPQTVDSEQSDKDSAKEFVNGRSLTAEELEEYTEWIQERSNYGFLLSEWENPTQVNLYEVFYNGAEIAREGTEAEKQAFMDRNGLQEINTDFYAMDKAAVSAMVFEKVGLAYDMLVAKGNEGLENWYDAENDSFCTETGDTNYVKFICTDGMINEEGTRVTLHCDGDDWVEACKVMVAEGEGERMFLSNHIISGLILDVEEEPVEETEDTGKAETAVGCLIDEYYFENLHTDADVSAVENSYILGDWSQITKEALQGIWYHHPKDVGESKEYDVVLQFDGDNAVVYYPAVQFDGDAYYEWDIVDRSDRGLCPELAIYWRGTKDGELAWYILGISEGRDYFWCNGEVFYRQKIT